MREEIIKSIEGYSEVVRDIEALKKYGYDYRIDRGEVVRLIERLHPALIALRVVDIIQETLSTKTFRLAPEDGYLPPFLAGQYIAIIAEIGNIRTSRAYSISSAPHVTGYYDITVRRVSDGFVSNYLLDTVKIGDVLFSSGPAGNFYHNPITHGNELVFIAGGSGITPFMSMIREISQRGINRTVHLFYGNRDESDIIFHDEILAIAKKNPRICYYPVVEKASSSWKGLVGFITRDILLEKLKTIEGKTFFLCGPKGLYDFIEPVLSQLNIPKKKIRREMYGQPSDVTKQSGWPAEIPATKEFEMRVEGKGAFRAKAGESLLVSLERAGVAMPSLCRSGECSMCRAKLLSGKVWQPDGVLLRKSDRRYGYIHTCAAYPISDVVIACD